MGRPNQEVDAAADLQSSAGTRSSFAGELSGFFDDAAIGMHWVDHTGRILAANRCELDMLGYQHDAYVGRHLSDFHVDPHVPIEILSRVAAGEAIRSLPARLRCQDGSLRWVEISAGPCPANGHLGHIRCFTLDVTAIRLAEEGLRTNEALMRAVLDSAIDAIVTIDAEGQIVSFNAAAERMFGYSSEEIIGNNVSRLMPPPYSEEHGRYVARYLMHGSSKIIGIGREAVGLRRDGSVFPIDLSVSEVRENGIHLFTGIVRDITERKRNEQALYDANARLASVLEASTQVSIISTDTNGLITVFNSGAENLLGYSSAEMIGQHTPEAFHLRSEVEQRGQELTAELGREVRGFEAFVAYAKEGRHERREWTYVRKDGQRRTVSLVVTAVYGADGKLIGFLGVAEDITERKLSEIELQNAKDALAASEHQLRAIIEATPKCVKLVDASGCLLDMNATGLALIEADSLEQVRGVCVYSIVAEDHRDAFRTMNERVCQGEKQTLQFDIVGLRGTRRTMLTSAVPLTMHYGSVVHLAITRDVTEQVRQDAALKAAKEVAEAASRAKTQFLANMSHEIRTPLNAVIGMTELALDTPLSAEQREYIEIARDSGESLLAIVNDILDFSKIEAGKEELRNEPFCFREELKAVVRSHRNRAELNGIQLACQVADEIPERLIGDRYKLRQLLNNLIGNAVKFTPSGSVCVTAAVYEQLAERIALHIEVADTGIGLPADQISKVFDPFCQADGSTTRRFGGTGLGLAISAQLAKLMGGTIWVASSPGEGSIFHFTAQFDVDTSHRTEAAKHSSAESRPQARSLRILLAEDHPINQKYASHLLQKHGHQVLIAENGRRAVEYYRTHPIDIILMDVQMPEMDGIEATGEIRSHERLTGRHCPVIALTAHATKEDRDRCLGVGMDGYLTKPISASELLPAIDDILRAQAVRDHKISPCEPQSADLDINAALELTDGDEALLKELIGLHQRHSPILLTEIREALQAGDCTAVERKAHTLKGTLGVLCANRSRHSAFALEEFAADRNIDGCNKVFCELIQGLTALEGLLAEATNGAV